MKKLLLALILFPHCLLYAQTLVSLTVSPTGASLQTGSTITITPTCTYSDNSTDNCANAGGATFTSSRFTSLTVSSGGVATQVSDPGAGASTSGVVVTQAGSLKATTYIFGQHPGDTWYQFPTPDLNNYIFKWMISPPAPSLNVVVGSTVTVGSAILVNNATTGTGSQFSKSCNYSSSDPTKATVTQYGMVTAVGVGSVTITCGRAGDAVFGNSTDAGWVAPGTTVTLNVVNGGTSNQTWYVRPDGGTPYTATSTNGQCTGLSDAPYPGTVSAEWRPATAYALGATITPTNSLYYQTVTTAGTSGTTTYQPTWGTTTTDGTVVWTQGAVYPKDQACALGNIRYLWSDETTYLQHQWMISGGDTVIVRQNPNGYDTGAYAPASTPYATPVNCVGNEGECYMPTVPSGTAAQHTRILGENYASCHSDSAKTLLDGTWGASFVFNVKDSQYVDIACFEVTDRAACGGNSFFTNTCHSSMSYAANGIVQSALTSNVNYTDLYIHGLSNGGIYGATGKDIVADHITLSGLPSGGGVIDMDDDTWNSGNMSVAGGFTMTNSLTQFGGCVEQYPITLAYPFIECRDQSTANISPDGLGTAATTGDWDFDHDIWFFNFQDGLDLLHSGMQSLTVTNSQSIANDGQAYKIGSAANVTMRNDFAEVNCNRVLYVIGDMPASAIVPGVTPCRAEADGIPMSMTDIGAYYFQSNTYVGYNSTPFDLMCDGNYDYCNHATAAFQDDTVLGYSDPLWTVGGGQLPALFYLNNASSANMPPLTGWSVRDHNNFYNLRTGACPSTLNAGETCTTNPAFTGQPASPISAESQLDNYNIVPSTGSPLLGAGTGYTGIPATDIFGVARPDPPSIGAAENPSTTVIFSGGAMLSGKTQ